MLFRANLGPELIIANLVALGIAMTFHEFAHNYVGYLMGDPYPRQAGRLTLNPFVHINWLGWLMFAIIGFGVLGSAPISPYRMRNPRWGYLAAVAAGPLTNLALAIIVAIPLSFFNRSSLGFILAFPNQINAPQDLLKLILLQTVLLNLLLFFFNILPLFPLDGWHIVFTLLPPDLAQWWEQNRMMSYYLFIGLIFASFANIPILSRIIGDPTYELFFKLVFRR